MSKFTLYVSDGRLFIGYNPLNQLCLHIEELKPVPHEADVELPCHQQLMLVFLVTISLLQPPVDYVLNCLFLVVADLVKESLALGSLVGTHLFLTFNLISTLLGP